MSSFKEIKGRIATVRSTLKITSAMKMISSVKLHRAQNAVAGLLPYQNNLSEILEDMISDKEDYASLYFEKRDVKRVIIIAISSNTTMCGAFNSNVIKKTQNAIDEYINSGIYDITIYTLGKVISKHFAKTKYKIKIVTPEIVDKPRFESAYEFANEIMTLFQNKKTDKVDIIYTHFKSRASQVVTKEQYLPYTAIKSTEDTDKLKKNQNQTAYSNDFIFEPDRKEVAASLIEKVIKLKIFSAVSDSSAAEHASRMLAMQIATDNANNMIEELTLQYNKSRQQAITNELMDIMGGFR